MKIIEVGSTVKVISQELSPYINTTKSFKVVSNKPYGKVDGWIDISNEEESIITQARLVKVI